MLCYDTDEVSVMKKLNEAKDRIYLFIREAQERNGFPPTVREICDAVGLASPASVHRYLKQLRDEGLIRSDPNKKRAYSVSAHKSGQENVPLLGKSRQAFRSPLWKTERTTSLSPPSCFAVQAPTLLCCAYPAKA